MKKLRILNISKPYVAAAYRQKFKYLATDSRFEVGLITGTSWAGQTFESLSDEAYWIRTLDIGLNGKNHFHYYKGLRLAFEEFKPDIVNVEEEHYSLVTLQVIREAKKIGAKCLFYTWQNIDKKYPPPFSWIESYVFKNSSYAVTGNQEALDILRRKGYEGPGQVIPQMGADAEAIAKAQESQNSFRVETRLRLNIPEQDLLLVFAGRFVEEKGIQDVLTALAQICSRGGRVHLMLIGKGEFEAELRKLSETLGLAGLVHWIGSVASLQIYKYLGVADACVLPSHTRANWKEQFGRILVESMLSGTVPIGSDSGEIPQVIGEAGLVHREGNPEDLARCIEILDKNRDELHRLSVVGKARVKEHYTNEIIALKFADIFYQIGKN